MLGKQEKTMKMILQTFLIMATFQTALADTKMDDKTCQRIATDESLTLFSTVNNADLYNPYGSRRENEPLNYIEAIKKNLSANYKNFCDSSKDNVTVEAFMEHQQNACSSQCDKDSNLFKPFLIGKHTLKIKVVNICKDLCKKSYEKLEYLKLGTILAKESSQQAAPDCSGAVSDKGRGVDVKAIQFNIDTNTTETKTTGK